MSETNGADEHRAQTHAGAQGEAHQDAGPGEAYEPIPDHLTDEALDGTDRIKRLAEARIAEVEAERDAAKEQALRLAAELENTRRRADRERQEAARYGLNGFARDLLSVADNLAKAVELAPEDPSQMPPEGLKGLVNGVAMTEKELMAVFERHGVRRVDPKGEPFDPNLHQAIAQVPGGGLPKDHVADVAAPGFVNGDRVLRAAMVTVSTGAEHRPDDGGEAAPQG